jgi:hypothetical protein
MEKLQIELQVDGDIVKQIGEASAFVAYLNDSLKPEGGEALGPIQTRAAGPSDHWLQVLVDMGKVTIPSLIHLLIAYRNRANAKVKIKRGNTSIEVQGKLTAEQKQQLIDFVAK